jgi:hypothetical protein
MTSTHTLIVGASAAGLATAACLQKEGIDYIILEKQALIAHNWRNHYDRLHLHTNKRLSNMPFKKFDADLPTYPHKTAVVEYLESYQKEQNIQPAFETEVLSVKKEGDYWITKTNKADYQSRYVVIATGKTRQPRLVDFKGLNTFKGQVLHSSAYKNGESFKGKNILIVGFGNSGCEQAIDLHEYGAYPAMSVRSPVNILPRDVFGIPILELSLMMSALPPRLADTINAPLMRVLVGDVRKLGLKKGDYGPLEQIQKTKMIPLLDIGTVKLIRQGHIKIYGNIEHIEGNKVYFEGNKSQDFDAIILATGYAHGLEQFVEVDKSRFEDLDTSIDSQRYFGAEGLYFCGFYITAKGMLREIALDAQKIAKHIARQKKQF